MVVCAMWSRDRMAHSTFLRVIATGAAVPCQMMTGFCESPGDDKYRIQVSQRNLDSGEQLRRQLAAQILAHLLAHDFWWITATEQVK